MLSKFSCDMFEYEILESKLTFSNDVNFLDTAVYRLSLETLALLKREAVSSIVVDMSKIIFIDGSAELFLYQLVKLFQSYRQSRVVIFTNDKIISQQAIVQNMLLLNSSIHIEFYITEN